MLDNPRSQAFVNSTISLVNSLVIKSDMSIKVINSTVAEDLSGTGYIIDEDPSTWRFYRHIFGKYHAVDKMMTVRSLDTLATINFTAENMLIHRATAVSYAYGTDYHNALVERFPEQELLIRGIVNPCNVAEPWSKPDGTILNYEPTLVEGREIDLMYDLQNWLYNYSNRWIHPDMQLANNLYAASAHGSMIVKAVNYVLNLREGNVFTNQVHSFHVKEYLRSYMYLDQYLDHLTTDQMMYLYRNISYIIQNIGKETTFNTLIKKLLTDVNVPLVGYTLRNNYQAMNFEGGDVTHEVLQFKVGNTSRTNTVVTYDVDTLIEKVNDEAPGNELTREAQSDKIHLGLDNSKFTSIPTKVFESSITDTSQFSNYNFTDLLQNEWIHLVGENRYNASFVGTNQVTNEILDLTAKEALLMYHYIYNYVNGIELQTIPKLVCFYGRVIDLPSPEEIMSFISPKYRRFVQEEVEYIANGHTNTGTYTNALDFYDYCAGVYEKNRVNRIVVANIQHREIRGQLDASMYRYLESKTYDFGEGEDFPTWMSNRGVVVSTFTVQQLTELMNAIVVSLLGTSAGEEDSLESRHNALMSVFRKLTSYDNMYLQTVNSEGMILSDWPGVRIGDISIDRTLIGSAEIPNLVSDDPTFNHYLNGSIDSGDGIVDYTVIPPVMKASIELDLSSSTSTTSRNVYIGEISNLTGSYTILND